MGSVVGGREDVQDNERERVSLGESRSVGKGSVVGEAEVLIAVSQRRTPRSALASDAETLATHRIQ